MKVPDYSTPISEITAKSPSTSVPSRSSVSASSASLDLLCFSHLRWNFVYQRPQHLLSRATGSHRVFFIEEPLWGDTTRLEVRSVSANLTVVVPHLPHGMPHNDVMPTQRRLLNELISSQRIRQYVSWYYTPMALAFTDHLQPRLTIYDCMDELSAFLGAPPQLLELEQQLINRADLVFTGGYSLYEAKQHRHPRVFAFPSSIDYNHFQQARGRALPVPADQQPVSQPRIGFSGVIDERFDYELMRDLAQRRPDWQFVLLGPTVKIDPALLPQGPNIHYLGMKSYQELPVYFSGWDAAILPFALNESTRYISPTKTPEYLAAGLPTVSTPIRDVVRSYGSEGLVQIADTAQAFETALAAILNDQYQTDWNVVDRFLQENSWDRTWQEMNRLMQAQLKLVTEQ